jgi:hypothetical protein
MNVFIHKNTIDHYHKLQAIYSDCILFFVIDNFIYCFGKSFYFLENINCPHLQKSFIFCDNEKVNCFVGKKNNAFLFSSFIIKNRVRVAFAYDLKEKYLPKQQFLNFV